MSDAMYVTISAFDRFSKAMRRTKWALDRFGLRMEGNALVRP